MNGVQDDEMLNSPSPLESGLVGEGILSTKQLPKSLIQSAFEQGYSIECIPFIKTEIIINELLSSQINSYSKQNINVAFTSGIAANAVADVITLQPQWNIYCIKGQTRKNIEMAFPQSTIITTGNDGAALAEKIILLNKDRELVFFCGDRRMDALPDMLKNAGIQLIEYIVYKTQLTPQKINKKYRAILFFSPSGVESFFSVNSISDKTDLFSIGNTTTKAIQQYCNNKVHTATNASAENVIYLLEKFHNK